MNCATSLKQWVLERDKESHLLQPLLSGFSQVYETVYKATKKHDKLTHHTIMATVRNGCRCASRLRTMYVLLSCV